MTPNKILDSGSSHRIFSRVTMETFNRKSNSRAIHHWMKCRSRWWCNSKLISNNTLNNLLKHRQQIMLLSRNKWCNKKRWDNSSNKQPTLLSRNKWCKKKQWDNSSKQQPMLLSRNKWCNKKRWDNSSKQQPMLLSRKKLCDKKQWDNISINPTIKLKHRWKHKLKHRRRHKLKHKRRHKLSNSSSIRCKWTNQFKIFNLITAIIKSKKMLK